ncbi:putative UDP-glucuronosyl/UDP-glucosyltransferase, UDP-glycosyltransferase family [Helianthus annuus]|uniref:Glycosyltransferase n=1 Tax=Helianthus annuus TaxID=4232 RepID=A0A9K3H332_HELAN|nr:UDP-glycosyltransferase 73C4 [Helianthus annuus]KAF5765687.1 putative UDP-glucuronosyl/UDP-glucosyltransferase, UDP-glycosyltransferase family [Helianthus annuus]KAJ0474077.1 putative UDP-glucuronosyl/UDP-glucosyltransferase, UDP-glycosyltransferase family [Helianthus annuus]
MASNLHFLIIPLMCPGHLIPMVDMAKLIAQHSVTVTVVITPGNAKRYGAVLHRAIASGLPVKLLQLQFPASDHGLPDGCESVDDLPTFNLTKNFFDALATFQKPLEHVFNNLEPIPSCIISDKHLTWTAEVANKFRIPWVIFDGMSCFTQLATHNLCVSKIHEKLSDFDTLILPGLPDKISMTKAQLPGLFNPGSSAKAKEMLSIRERIREAELEAYGTLINSFDALETRYIDQFRKVKQGRVWCIGPFSNSNKNDLDKAQRGSKDSINNHECMTWLDSQRNRSVIYACLGSLTRLTPLQFIELALGLEDSQFAFILVVKGGSRTEEIEQWLGENGFESRVKGRGVLIRGWASQVLILSHPAVGAFLTHCGWNSTIEGVCAGVPMIAWPQFAEQFFNERLVVQVLGTGVGVGAQRVMHLDDDNRDAIQVKRGDVCKAVKMVMDEGREGEERREKAKYLKQMAAKTLEEEGSSQLNLKLFIEEIRLHTHKGQLVG